MRVGILSLIHESNTFAVTPTTIDLFRRDELMIGDEVRWGYEYPGQAEDRWDF